MLFTTFSESLSFLCERESASHVAHVLTSSAPHFWMPCLCWLSTWEQVASALWWWYDDIDWKCESHCSNVNDFVDAIKEFRVYEQFLRRLLHCAWYNFLIDAILLSSFVFFQPNQPCTYSAHLPGHDTRIWPVTGTPRSAVTPQPQWPRWKEHDTKCESYKLWVTFATLYSPFLFENGGQA